MWPLPKKQLGSVKTQKPLEMRGLSNSLSKLFQVVYNQLFTHAEVAEDVLKDFVGGDFAACDCS